MATPSPLGAQRAFGFGDRFGFGARAHVAAARDSKFAPVFAQQSAAELRQSGRSPGEVLAAAEPSAREFGAPWGADADRMATAEAIESFAAAGFSRFTLDPSAYFVERASPFSAGELESAAAALVEDGVFAEGWIDLYVAREFPISESASLRFDPDELRRIAVKFGWAMAFAEELAAHARQACGGRSFEVEISLLRTATCTTPLEHLFLALESQRRGLPLVAIAPQLPSLGVLDEDFAAESAEFERALGTHVAIAGAFGPHQVSVPEIEEKSSVLSIIGRTCGERLHAKTSAASALEMLRVVARLEPAFFREILVLAQERFPFDRNLKPVTLSEDDVRFLPDVSDAQLESTFLGDARGRQLLDVTIGSIWASGLDSRGRSIRERLAELVYDHTALIDDLLATNLRNLIGALNAG